MSTTVDVDARCRRCGSAMDGAACAACGQPLARAAGKVSTPVVVCGILALLSVIAAFSSPGMLISALAFGGYGHHLYNGGRELIGEMADGRTRSRAWIVWAFIAALATSVGFTAPASFAVALGAAGYAIHLFRGGRDVVRAGRDGTTRSATWLYYAVIALIAAAVGLSHPATLLVAVLAGAYSVYLFRGGRWVLWIW